MSTGTSLIRAVLAGQCTDEAFALRIIEAALALEVDPLAFCAHRYGIGWPLVIERAAAWAGLASFPDVPQLAEGAAGLRRLDSLGDVRALRTNLMGRDVLFIAPRFEHLLHLKTALAERPEMAAGICLVPPGAVAAALTDACAEELMDEARQRLFRRWPKASASVELTVGARLCFVLLVAAVIALLALAPPRLQLLSLTLIGALVMLPALLRLVAVFFPAPARAPDEPIEDAALPVYSVLLPLRDEAQMVSQLAASMAALDYPPEKLDIKFVVEARSASTVAAVRRELGDPRFELVIVPDAPPRTKPKAMNYALPLLRGELVVVYDAEDIPDPDQLRRAAARFAADPGIDCLQAQLVVDNADEHPIAALFAGEYAGQFGILLPRLADWKLPIPLGGTSNHFRVAPLRQLGGWDAFNVTEDADLGIRLARFRHRCGVLDSATHEEAPVSLAAWMAQRTRWMTGWMTTLIVHNRHPRAFLADIGWRGFLFVQIYVGSLILAPLLHTAFLGGLLIRWLTGALPQFEDAVTLLVMVALGYTGAIAIVVVGLARQRRWRTLPAQLLLPLYWLLHTLATLRAAVDLLRRPFHWHKTEHGRTRLDRRHAAEQRMKGAGRDLRPTAPAKPVPVELPISVRRRHR